MPRLTFNRKDTARLFDWQKAQPLAAGFASPA
jgi:hypothetical protein